MQFLKVKIGDTHTYRVIQEERSIFWDVIISVIVRKKVRINMCLILNDYGDKAV